MTQNLRLGEYYALTKLKPKQFKTRYTSLLAVTIIMCADSWAGFAYGSPVFREAHAQCPEPSGPVPLGIHIDSIKPLQIGDTIPDEVWNMPLQVVNHPKGKKTITLADYKGKLIILDFWATWCGACLEGFPKMDSLKAAFGDNLAIILINAKQTGDNIERVQKTLERLRVETDYDVKLPYVVGDSILQQFFPHHIVPHYVWIDMDGKLAATTFNEDVTKSSVAAFLKIGRADIHIKNDIPDFDAADTPLHEIARSLGVVPAGQSMLTGYIEGLGFSGGVTETPDSNLRIYQINTPLAVLYNMAFKDRMKNLPKSHFIFRLESNSDFRERYFGIHERDNRYCYERIVPKGNTTDIPAIMGADLAGYFNVHVKRERVKTDVLILTAVPSADNRPKGNIRLPVGRFVKRLNMFSPIPVINESKTGYTVEIEIPASLPGFSAQQMKVWLEQHGFSMSSGERVLEAAVFENVQQRHVQ
ncbi:TlpA family protein disulfide reductase [Parapedobacter tibetensis]|uniref:TlpA family protein disulfide reductase n=1 Tax=Parapedobacter tibetensis TaxID=2972951 RepID=UPI00214DA8AF|nr:TlpA disulfide reductase family protein [Parapedobacter tibetensis]